jgi:hypothetical protein
MTGITENTAVGMIVFATKDLLQNMMKNSPYNGYLGKEFHVNNQNNPTLITFKIVPVNDNPPVLAG